MHIRARGHELRDVIGRVNVGTEDIGDIPDMLRPRLAEALKAAVGLVDVATEPDRDYILSASVNDADPDALAELERTWHEYDERLAGFDKQRRIPGLQAGPRSPFAKAPVEPEGVPVVTVTVAVGRKLAAPDHGNPSIFEASRN